MVNKNIVIIGTVAFVILTGSVIFALGGKPKGGSKAGSAVANDLLNQANELQKTGKVEEAKATYTQIISEHPDIEDIAGVQQKLETLNMNLILTNTTGGKNVIHEVQAGDTLGKLAKKYGTTVELIKRKNHITSDVIRLGQKLTVWNAPFNVFVDKSQNILILKTGNEVVKVYNVSTGENNNTPVGTFKVTTKLVHPVWYKGSEVIPPESPENVLGTRWMGFDIAGYGIHGTTQPEMIGQQVTAGCVRMRNSEVEELYDIIPTGTEVVVVD